VQHQVDRQEAGDQPESDEPVLDPDVEFDEGGGDRVA
jgi:hypothetical protein